MVTKSGLVFIGGGNGYFSAFDKRTGKEVWRAKIPFNNVAKPMTYRTGRPAVHRRGHRAGADNALVAFALNEKAAAPR